MSTNWHFTYQLEDFCFFRFIKLKMEFFIKIKIKKRMMIYSAGSITRNGFIAFQIKSS